VPHREGNSMGVIEPFSATLAQDGLAECDQPGKKPLKYSAVAGNRTRTELSTRRVSSLKQLHVYSWV